MDPLTGDYPEDPNAGFLPPYNPETGYEIGWMEFQVKTWPNLPTGVQVTNQALVQFDFMGPWGPAPKDAPWLNTIDADPPSSAVAVLPATIATNKFNVSWSGNDVGVGVGSYDLYVSDNGGPWQLWLSQSTNTTADFTGTNHHTYAFYSLARDYCGNVEPAKTQAEAQTTISAKDTPVITWANPADIFYGTALGGAQLNATANVPGTFTYYPPAGTVLDAGNGQVLKVTFTPLDTDNYTTAETAASLNVLQKALVITADKKTKLLGAALPALTAGYAGFANGDTETCLDTPVVLTTTATASSPVGVYPIIAGGAADANYAITFVNGTLTIIAINLSLAANPLSVVKSTPTTVTFTLYVPPDPNFLPTSPNVQRLKGTAWTVAATRMYDDGTNGDAVPGDNLYAVQLVLNESTNGPISFRSSVAYKGQILRKYSNTNIITVAASAGFATLAIRVNNDQTALSRIASLSMNESPAGNNLPMGKAISITITVSTVSGKTYILEYADNLAHSKWTPLQTIVGNGEAKSFTHGLSTVQRYYRVREE